jgi:hypothetical protein
MLLKREVMYSHIPLDTIQALSLALDMRVRQTSGPFGTVRDYHGLLRRVGRLIQIAKWGVENGRCCLHMV